MILKRYIRKEVNKFFFFGLINLFATNIILQISLLFINPISATFFSQLFNTLLGFYVYGYKVFNVRNLKVVCFIKYLTLAVILWNMNWILIIFVSSYGFSRNLSSLLIVPLLAIISYIFQKYIVFV